MRKALIAVSGLLLFCLSCSVRKTIIKSTLGYSSTLIIPASTNIDSPQSAKNIVINFDRLFGAENSTTHLTDAIVSSAKIELMNNSSQKFDIFKSVKLFLIDENSEVMIGSKNETPENIGNNLVLEIDNTRFIDNYIKDGKIKLRLDYVLKKSIAIGLSIKASFEVKSMRNNN